MTMEEDLLVDAAQLDRDVAAVLAVLLAGQDEGRWSPRARKGNGHEGRPVRVLGVFGG